MLDNEHPEIAAFRELEALVRGVGEELGAFRRRALQAEGRLRSIEASQPGGLASRERLEALELENQQLRARLDAATERMRQMLDRVRFLRQQSAGGDR